MLPSLTPPCPAPSLGSWFFPTMGVAAANANLHHAATLGIFIISGLLLQRGEMLTAVRSTEALAYGLVAILAATPMLAFAVLRLPLQPPEMALGLAVFCCMPTTLSACVALTTASGGNAAVALLLTVVTNMLGVRWPWSGQAGHQQSGWGGAGRAFRFERAQKLRSARRAALLNPAVPPAVCLRAFFC